MEQSQPPASFTSLAPACVPRAFDRVHSVVDAPLHAGDKQLQTQSHTHRDVVSLSTVNTRCTARYKQRMNKQVLGVPSTMELKQRQLQLQRRQQQQQLQQQRRQQQQRLCIALITLQQRQRRK